MWYYCRKPWETRIESKKAESTKEVIHLIINSRLRSSRNWCRPANTPPPSVEHTLRSRYHGLYPQRTSALIKTSRSPTKSAESTSCGRRRKLSRSEGWRAWRGTPENGTFRKKLSRRSRSSSLAIKFNWHRENEMLTGKIGTYARLAYNPITLKYDETSQGQQLRSQDE